MFTQWPLVRPFVLRAASRFRPGPPPALGSKDYTAAYAEVKSLGSTTSTTRTPDQTQIAQFGPPDLDRLEPDRGNGGARPPRNADAERTAVRTARPDVRRLDDRVLRRQVHLQLLASRHRNRATDDPNWTPLANTAQDPSYPGAHAVISAAAAAVLVSEFGNAFPFSATSSGLPDVQRSFTSFSAAANEAALSRIYAGQHFRTDEEAGQKLGAQVAGYVLGKSLLPVHHG